MHKGLYLMLYGELNGNEIQKGNICIHTADSLHCIAETNAIL